MTNVVSAFLKVDIPTSRPRLLSDNEPEFKNDMFDSYCKSLGITNHFFVLYRPQSNGTVERFNGLFIGMLRGNSDEGKSEDGCGRLQLNDLSHYRDGETGGGFRTFHNPFSPRCCCSNRV